MTDINFLRLFLWLATITSAMATIQTRQPNIVFVMVDDMGWNDVSFHGSDQIQTPNIDTLAYHGVILQQYYSEAICTPARTALLTGKYPMRLGMHGTPLFNGENRGIPLTERLLPSYMKELGYATHLVGKWHVGMSRQEFLPTSRGYDSHYGMRGGYVDYYTYNKVETWPSGEKMFGLDLFENDVPQSDEQRYIVDVLTDRAIKVIERHNTSVPLFLHVTHNGPHAGNAGGALQPPLFTTVKNKHIADSNRRLYAEIVTSLDNSVGEIVNALADKDILDNTIIVFVSDNGAPTVGSMRNWGVNLPFRGIKWTPWEGGVRVPALIWHASLKPKVWEGLMHITDWLPTLIAAAGGGITTDIDGINQWDSITLDRESNRREVLIAIDDSNRNAYAAYRAGDYKLIVGNVTGLNNGYYGAESMANKQPPRDYFPSLRSCETAKLLETMGMYLAREEVEAFRIAATIKQRDRVRDTNLCEPTLTRGCLFNVRRDPAERHNLWEPANKIAMLLTGRLRGLWAMQQRRGPVDLRPEANPINFGYTWWPFLVDTQNNTQRPNLKSNGTRRSLNSNSDRNTTLAAVINCDGATTGIRNFLCILKSIF